MENKNMREKIWLILFIFSLVLTGCSSKNGDIMYKQRVEDFLKGYQSLDGSVGQYLVNYNENDVIKFNGIQAILAKQMTFDIGKIEQSDNTYLVNVTINNVDFQAVFEEVIEEYTLDDTEEDILEKLNMKLENDSAKRKDFEVKIPVQKSGDTYEIVLTAELSNALFGGYNEYLTTLTGGMFNE